MTRFFKALTVGFVVGLLFACSPNEDAGYGALASEQPAVKEASSPDDLVAKLSAAEERLLGELTRAIEINESMKAEVNALREECFRLRYEGEDYHAQLRQIENRLKALGTLQKYQEGRERELGTVREALDKVSTTRTVDELVKKSTRKDLSPLLAESIVYNESTWDDLARSTSIDSLDLARRLKVSYVPNPTFNTGKRRFDVRSYLENLEFNLLNGDDRGDLELLESEEWLKRKLEELPKIESRFQELPDGSISDRMILADIRRQVVALGILVHDSPIDAITAIAPLKLLAAEIEVVADREKTMTVLMDVSGSIRQWIHLQYKIRCYAEIQELWRDLDAATNGGISLTSSALSDFATRITAIERVCEIVNPGGAEEVRVTEVEDAELVNKLQPTYKKLQLWVGNLHEAASSLALRAVIESLDGKPSDVLLAADKVLRQNPRNRYAQSHARSAYSSLIPEEQDIDSMLAKEVSAATLLAVGFSAKQIHGTGTTVTELFRSGATWAECRELGATVSELIAVGASLGQLRLAGFSWAELFEANITWVDVVALEPTFANLMDSDVTPRDLREAGATASELREFGANWGQLYAAGFELSQVRAAGATYQELALAGFATTALRNDGASVRDLRSAGVTWSHLLEAGYSLTQLYEAGADYSVFRVVGATLESLHVADIPVSIFVDTEVDCKQLIGAGWTWSELVEARFTWDDLSVAGISLKAIRSESIAWSDLHVLGASWTALNEIGATGKDLREAGATYADLYQAGFDVASCIALGASNSELIQAGYSFASLKVQGVSLSDVIGAHVDWPNLLNQGFTVEVLQRLEARWKDLIQLQVPLTDIRQAGASWEDLLDAGASRPDLIAIGAPFVLADFAPKTVTQLKPDTAMLGATFVGGEVRLLVHSGANVLVMDGAGNEVNRKSALAVFDSDVASRFIVTDGGSNVAAASSKSVRVWDLEQNTIRLSIPLKPDDGALVSISINNRAGTVGLLTKEKGLQVWSYMSSTLVGIYSDGSFARTRNNLALSDSGELAAFSSGNRIDLVDVRNGTAVARFRDLPNPNIARIRIGVGGQIWWLHTGSTASVFVCSTEPGSASTPTRVAYGEPSLMNATDLILDCDGQYAVLAPSGLRFGTFDSELKRVASYQLEHGSMIYSREHRYLIVWSRSTVVTWTPAGH